VRRFESKVFVALPTLEDRINMVLYFCEGIDVNLTEEDLRQIAVETDAWSGSEIEVQYVHTHDF
jgi:SpoVK/Ycf46/Vps4 family AAA+-type ATPase